MKLLIVVHHRLKLWNVPAWFGERLAMDFPELQVVQLDSYEGVEPHLRDAELIFTISLKPEQFKIARSLKWIHAPTAAVHQFMFPELVEGKVVLTNSREVHGPVVAEHVMAMIFALAKKIPQAVIFQQKSKWGQEEIWYDGLHPREIAGATLGLIGIGSIGSRVAQMASSLGMRVLAVREHVEKEKPEGVSEVFPPSELDTMLRQSDYVVLAAPLMPSTTGLINAQRLAAMKKEGCLINVGRGPQVEEASLAAALRSGRIAGAALDVFDREPLPSGSPLWSVPNLLITPHTAGLTEKLWHRHYALFSGNLRRYLSKRPLQFIVDKRRGY
ncbi:MAG TPA: D-2-hydroxyacid dehydrogenase [Candidatus Sulfotelmatobacter sp.]|nr:D-2-hydroxyacid dehydrogenase [Candidatus Sulfotelmatobacter sp.]